MNDNRINVTRAALPPMEEYIKEISPLWDSHWITNIGEKHKQLQRELCEYLGVENLELFVNGHMSLELTLQTMDLKGEVITTPFTFASTTHAIIRNGLEPVFCDIDPVTLTIDTKKIRQLITEKTCAIVPVHVYGNICDVDEIQKIAEEYHLKVIYDAAHAFGETYQGKGVGSFGDASCFSFHATKVFNTIEGGAVCFRNPEMGEIIRDLKNFGIHGPEEVAAIGANAKMNEFCAAMGLCNLRHIDEEISKRKMVADRYRERLENIPGITLNKVQDGVKYNYAYFPVFFDESVLGVNRDDIKLSLEKEGIYPRKYFYPLANAFAAYGNKYDPSETPVAKRISESVLTLPLYADLDLSVVDQICYIIQSRISSSTRR